MATSTSTRAGNPTYSTRWASIEILLLFAAYQAQYLRLRLDNKGRSVVTSEAMASPFLNIKSAIVAVATSALSTIYNEGSNSLSIRDPMRPRGAHAQTLQLATELRGWAEQRKPSGHLESQTPRIGWMECQHQWLAS